MEADFKSILEMQTLLPEDYLELLGTIKHTRLEGAIMEHEANQVLFYDVSSSGDWAPISALALRLISRRDNKEKFLVLPEKKNDPSVEILIRHLRRTGSSVHILKIDDGHLFIDGKIEIKPSAFTPEDRSEAHRDSERLNAIYWGFARHIGDAFLTLVRDIVIKDWYITQGAKFLWDLDRFVINRKERIVFCEIKHKFPDRAGFFGLNRGSEMQMRQLLNAGLGVVHIILAKPIWNAGQSPMYLYFDRRARESALWLITDFSDTRVDRHNVRDAPHRTSVYGKSPVGVVRIDPGNFSVLGRNAEPANTVRERFVATLDGRMSELEPCSLRLLQQTRIG